MVYAIDDPASLFMKKVSLDDVVDMIKPISDDEMKKALFSIDDNKASGPDGYSSKFFKAGWSVVGKDVIEAVKEFFSTGKLSELNATLIALVPK